MAESGIRRIFTGLLAQGLSQGPSRLELLSFESDTGIRRLSKVAAHMIELQFQPGLAKGLSSSRGNHSRTLLQCFQLQPLTSPGVDRPSERGQGGPDAFYNLVLGVIICHPV